MLPSAATAATSAAKDGAHRQHHRHRNHHSSTWSLQNNKILVLILCSVMAFSTLSPYYVTMLYEDAAASSSSLSSSLLSFLQFQNPQEIFGEKYSGGEKSTLRKYNNTFSDQQLEQLPDYHVVFSTSCSDQQNWESYVFFYHARRVRQRGTVTRIVSGCSDKQAAELQAFHDQFIAPMAITDVPNWQSFHLHLTPDYGRVRLPRGTEQYKYMNKPYGMRHWMEHRLGLNLSLNSTGVIVSGIQSSEQHQRLLDGIVILMDPDMILLRPIGHDFSGDFELWVDGERPAVTKVTHGHPIAQQDGYLSNEWMKLNYSYITNDESIRPPDWRSGPRHWNTGPPYLATVADMSRIVSLWTETAPRTLEVFPKLFAEMYGFIWATVMLNLPFELTKSIVVSTTESTDREGWSMVDAIDDGEEICKVPITATSYNLANDATAVIPDLPTLPVGLHYCKRYILGEWFFSKYRLKKNIMNCDKSLLKQPDVDFYSPYLAYYFLPPKADLSDKDSYKEERHEIGRRQAKREAFMLCGLISAVNEALAYYKQQACDPATVNLNKDYTVHDDPTNHR